MNSRTIEVIASKENMVDLQSLLLTTGAMKHGEHVEAVEFPWKVDTVPLKITLSKEG